MFELVLKVKKKLKASNRKNGFGLVCLFNKTWKKKGFIKWKLEVLLFILKASVNGSLWYISMQIFLNTEEFQRAVKICTGSSLGPHIVNTVFNIFDVDGDGHLSYREFISIMKDRKYRGSRVTTKFWIRLGFNLVFNF